MRLPAVPHAAEIPWFTLRSSAPTLCGPRVAVALLEDEEGEDHSPDHTGQAALHAVVATRRADVDLVRLALHVPTPHAHHQRARRRRQLLVRRDERVVLD